MGETSHHTSTGFRNPWESALPPSWMETFSSPFPLEWAGAYLKTHSGVKELEVVAPYCGSTVNIRNGDRSLKATWLGHATVLVEMPPMGGSGKTVRILFDPIFSLRAGPTQYTGPKRLVPAPCQVKDLPGCDIVCISHNHYDHLDLASILSIYDYFPSAKFFAPLGNKAWFLGAGIPNDRVIEMDWWDAHIVDFSLLRASLGTGSSTDDVCLRVSCVPAQHHSGRGANDYCRTLWCGWVLEQNAARDSTQRDTRSSRDFRRGAVYFAGDTGYRRYSHSSEVCPVFAEIGEKLGPFDLSLIPIWRGGTFSFLSWVGVRLAHEVAPSVFHASPADAVAIHQDVRSRTSIGIHFGTFVGATQETLEAMVELKCACDEANVKWLADSDEDGDESPGPNGRMGVVNLGQTWVVQVEEVPWVS